MGGRSTFTLPDENDRARQASAKKLTAQQESDAFYERVRKFDEQQRQSQQQREFDAERPYYNPSLAMAISQRLGPGFQSAMRPDVKHYVQTESQGLLYGVHPLVDHITGTGGFGELPVKKDQVYALGPTPDAQTFAHEYRHRGGVHDEGENRFYDAMYARTPEDWKHVVDFQNQWDRQYDGQRDWTPEQSETELLRQLRLYAQYSRKHEYQAAPENDKPVTFEEPSVLGFIDQLLGDDEQAKFMRAKLPYESIPGVIKPDPSDAPVPQPPVYRYSPTRPPLPKRTNR